MISSTIRISGKNSGFEVRRLASDIVRVMVLASPSADTEEVGVAASLFRPGLCMIGGHAPDWPAYLRRPVTA